MKFQRLILFIALPLYLGCSSHQKDLTTDRGTMNEGDRLAKNEFYDEARKQYLRIKTEFPQSSLQYEADLKIAESYYSEEAFPTAATSFEEFIKTYPGRPEVPDALYKLGMCYYNQMPSTPQRDTRSTTKVVDIFTRLMVDFPETKYSEEAQKHISSARHQLAEKIFTIGRFYERQSEYDSAARRFGELVDQFPDDKKVEEAMARQIQDLRKSGKADRAKEIADNFRSKFPASEFQSMVEEK